MCFIEDQCRRDREEHPTDSSLVCDVSRSQDEWTLTGNHVNGQRYTEHSDTHYKTMIHVISQ